MGPWAFGVPLILVSTLGLLLNGYILLVVLGLSKQVNTRQRSDIYNTRKIFPPSISIPLFFDRVFNSNAVSANQDDSFN